MDVKILESPKAPTAVTPSVGQPVFYVNICSVSITQEEAILQLGLHSLENPEVANGLATVYMSLPHTKRLYEALGTTLKQYESAFGEILTRPVVTMDDSVHEDLGDGENA